MEIRGKFGGNLGEIGGKDLTKPVQMWYNMGTMVKIDVAGIRAERVERTLAILGDRVQTLMNAYNGQEYRVTIHEHGPVHVSATIVSSEISTGREHTYEVFASGIDIASLRWGCNCPEAVYGGRRGYRLAVACKHALLLHALKSDRAAKQVAVLIDLLYGYKEDNHG